MMAQVDLPEAYFAGLGVIDCCGDQARLAGEHRRNRLGLDSQSEQRQMCGDQAVIA